VLCATLGALCLFAGASADAVTYDTTLLSGTSDSFGADKDPDTDLHMRWVYQYDPSVKQHTHLTCKYYTQEDNLYVSQGVCDGTDVTIVDRVYSAYPNEDEGDDFELDVVSPIYESGSNCWIVEYDTDASEPFETYYDDPHFSCTFELGEYNAQTVSLTAAADTFAT
jgi:hypothetical protein